MTGGTKINTRPWYNQGSCQNLKESPYILFLFIDDDESSWDNKEIKRAWDHEIKDALDFIESKAKVYGVDLKFKRGYYSTNTERKTKVKYDGIIVKNLMESSATEDALEQASKSLGFKSMTAMHEYLKSHTGYNQIAYVVMMNKDGRSYCMNHTQSRGNPNFLEHVMMFRRFLGTNNSYAGPIAHEILHLFGAEDYYDPYKNRPERLKLAKVIYPKDIMMISHREINQLELGAYTAYTIGWLDALPTECDLPEWWK